MDKATKKQLKGLGLNDTQIVVLEQVAAYLEEAGLSLGIDPENDQITIEQDGTEDIEAELDRMFPSLKKVSK